jgi:hypothetical protein
MELNQIVLNRPSTREKWAARRQQAVNSQNHYAFIFDQLKTPAQNDFKIKMRLPPCFLKQKLKMQTKE